MMNTKKMRMINSTLSTDKIDNVNSPHFTTTVSFHGPSSLHGHSSRTMLQNKDRHTIKKTRIWSYFCLGKKEKRRKTQACCHAACMQHHLKNRKCWLLINRNTKPSRSHTQHTVLKFLWWMKLWEVRWGGLGINYLSVSVLSALVVTQRSEKVSLVLL